MKKKKSWRPKSEEDMEEKKKIMSKVVETTNIYSRITIKQSFETGRTRLINSSA